MRCHQTGYSGGSTVGIPLTWCSQREVWGVELGASFLRMSPTSNPCWEESPQGGYILVDGFYRARSREFIYDSKTRSQPERFLVLVPAGRLPPRI